MPALPWLRLRIAQFLGVVSLNHFIAERLEIVFAQAVQLHAEVEDGNRDHMRRFAIPGSSERSARTAPE
ncbi:hypothetical protein M9Q32_14235 [Bradyrhizobium denitrificans]|nr:hypothetical protein [Bradyrhizobium denitrificans]